MQHFYTGNDDCQWLRETALKTANPPAFESFTLAGNEDCPQVIELFSSPDPLSDTFPVRRYTLDSSGTAYTPCCQPATVPLAPYELELFAYHISSIATQTGRFGLSCRAGILANVLIEPNAMSATDGPVWDSVTINGRSCGNRPGGARAYAKMAAGDPEWWRP